MIRLLTGSIVVLFSLLVLCDPPISDRRRRSAVVRSRVCTSVAGTTVGGRWSNATRLGGADGSLAEIWFDGGFAVPGLQGRLTKLLHELQPRAVVFSGCQEGTNVQMSTNTVIWIGTESGHSPSAVWNTQDDCDPGTGTPLGSMYMPKEVDLTLQNSDTWFYQVRLPPRNWQRRLEFPYAMSVLATQLIEDAQ
jgi:hypothetical protein|eukprot:COSAG01_NODE_963_length_12407_cov_38.330598_12_plen_193_part_00